MERPETVKEDWIAVGVDYDGTKAYFDIGSIVRDLEPATRFKVCLMHVPPQGSHAYAELLRVTKAANKPADKLSHVKQVVGSILLKMHPETCISSCVTTGGNPERDQFSLS